MQRNAAAAPDPVRSRASGMEKDDEIYQRL